MTVIHASIIPYEGSVKESGSDDSASASISQAHQKIPKTLPEDAFKELPCNAANNSELSLKRISEISRSKCSSKRLRSSKHKSTLGGKKEPEMKLPSSPHCLLPKENPTLLNKIEKAVVVARKILASGEFKELPEGAARSKDYDPTICQDQGTPSIRREAIIRSKTNPFAFCPETLRKAGVGWERNYRIIQLKRLGHALNLASDVSLSDKTSFHLRGFSESFTIPMIASSILQYSFHKDSCLSSEDTEWVLKLMQSSISHDSYNTKLLIDICSKISTPSCKQIFSLSSGYDWHSVHLFFFRGHLIFCNRGKGSKNAPGILVYQIQDTGQLNWSLLSPMIRRHKIKEKEWNQKYNIFSLTNTLKLKFVFHLKQREQVVGNCTYVSAKSAVRAALALKEIIRQIGEEGELPSKPDFWQNAFDATQVKYKEWNYFDKNLVIHDFVQDHLSAIRLPLEILPRTESQKIFNLIAEKVKKKPSRYKSLSGYFI